MTGKSEWVSNSLSFFYPYAYYYRNTKFTFHFANETQQIEYKRKTRHWTYLYLYDDYGNEIKTPRGAHKRIRLFDLIEISKTDRIRITASFDNMTIDTFFTPKVTFNDISGFDLDTFEWYLVTIPSESRWWHEIHSCMWSLLNPKINWNKKGKRILKHFEKSRSPYSWWSVGYAGIRRHIIESMYLRIFQVRDNLFTVKIDFGNSRQNSERILYLVHDKIYPLDKIPIEKIKQLTTMVYGLKNLEKNLNYYLARYWEFFYFPSLWAITAFFKGIQSMQKKFSKNYLRRIKRNISPVFEEINRLFYSIALNKFTATVLFVDTLIKPILFHYIDLERDFHDYIYPFFQTISKKFKELQSGRKQWNRRKLQILFNPLQLMKQSLNKRDEKIFNTLKLTCTYPKCSRPIHYWYVMQHPEIRNSVLNYYYNRKMNPDTPRLSFVCCNCVSKLKRTIAKRREMTKGMLGLFSNIVSWFNGLETIYMDSCIEEVEV